MDKNHRLDAPNNESLSTIEQLEDRSGLAATYPRARNDWDGIGLMSGQARSEKQAEERLHIYMSIRKWFPVLGLLIPLPAILLASMIAVAATYLTFDMAGFILLPVSLGVLLWGYISYKVVRGVYSIFYNHSIKATPYLVAHLALLGIGFQGLFTIGQLFHSGWGIGDVLIVCGVVLLASVILCGILLFIWTSKKILSHWKVAILVGLAIAIAVAQLIFTAP